MARTVIDQDCIVRGSLTSTEFTAPDGSITDDAIKAAAGIEASKLEHQFQKNVTQVHGTAATSERRVIHTVRGASGDVVAFRAGLVVPNTLTATVTIDLHKNGSTILSSSITLDLTNAAYEFESATIADADLVADDVLEVVINATAGTGVLGQGLFIEATIREDAD